jgi:hypothetical protein
MEKVKFIDAIVIQRSMISGYVIDFEIEYVKEKDGFQKDKKVPSVFRATFSGMTLRRWNYQDLDDDKIIELAFPFVVQWVTDRVKDKTLKDFEEGIISIDEVGPSYPYDTSKIKQVIGYEMEFTVQEEIISTRIEQNTLADEIIGLRDNINVLIDIKTNENLFKLTQERNILYLFRKVETVEQLTFATATLSNLVTDLNVRLLKKLVSNKETGDKSLTLLEKFLDKIDDDTEEIINVFRTIYKIRQAFPVHTDNKEIVQALEKFNISYGNTDYEKMWKILMTQYRNALKELFEKIKKYVA